MRLGNTTVISFINLKGGVGKTTSAVNFAATLSHSQQQGQKKPNRVLLIDLDSQSNTSQTILSDEDYEKLLPKSNIIANQPEKSTSIPSNKTLYSLFRYELERNVKVADDDDKESFDLSTIRVEKPIPTLPNLDLIPNSSKLMDIQDKLILFSRYYLSATDILYNALHTLKTPDDKAYTHIIIDCPPNLGLITLNALSLSRWYIIPVFLDAYSYSGLDTIFEKVLQLRRCKATCIIELLGILYTRINTRTTLENLIWEKNLENGYTKTIKDIKASQNQIQ